jgi:Cu/Ag efflux protein CusF
MVSACGSKKEPAADAKAGGTTTEHHDDAGAPPHTHDSTGASIPAPAASEVKTYTFHGTPTKIDEAAGMITIKHEKIGDLMDAMTMPFKVADPALLEQVAIGKETHFTLRVAGTEMLITKVQDTHDAGTEH